MMVINKRVSRNLKHNKAFFIGSTILCMLIVAFIIACTSTGSTMTNAINKFYGECHVEDAEFITAQEIPDDQIEALEKKYDLTLEQMKYVNVDYDNSTIRVFCETEKLNLAQVKEGKKYNAANEILLSETYCKNHDIEIGSSINLLGKDYKVTGYYTRPDYAYMLQSLSDLYIDNVGFGIALLPEEEFNAMSSIQKYYSVVYNKENTIDFRKDVNNEYQLLSYIDNTTNTRIKYAREEGLGISGMASSFAPILFILNMGFIAVALSRIVKRDRQNIGVMRTFGYRKRELCKFYIRYGMIIALCGALLGIIGGVLLINPFLNLYCAEFNFPNYTKTFSWASLVVAVILPFILFGLTAYLVVVKMTKQSAVQLLHGEENNEKTKNSKLLKGSKFSSATKYSVRSAIRNKARTIVFTFGIFIASAVILMGLVMNSSCDELMNKYLKGSVKYEYAYYLNSMQTEFNYENAQQLYRSSYETKDTHKAFLLIGIDYHDENGFMPDKDERGKKLKDGNVYISKALSMLLDKGNGDKITFINPITLEEYETKINGIIDNRTQKALYMSFDEANSMLGLEAGSYNAVYSSEKLPIDESIIGSQQKAEDLLSSFDSFLEPVKAIVYVLIILGILLGVIVISIITGMTVDENARNISMLKVLGYKTKEISRMVFRVNHVLILLAYIIAIPVVLLLCEVSLRGNIETMSIYMAVHANALDIILGIAVVYATYYVALMLAKRKVLKISMVESLKGNRE